MAKKSLGYATIRSPIVEAASKGLFRFNTRAQAVHQLDEIRRQCIVAKEQPEEGQNPVLRLWVKGFAITEDEEKQGYHGNYALLHVAPLADGKWTLIAKKEEMPLKQHPQRVRKKQTHPNWGHPILRKIKKNHIWPTVEEAQNALAQLHEEHPTTSIPLTNKLYCIIYSRETTPPASKYVLEIKAAETGGFVIEHDFNTYEPPKHKKEGTPMPTSSAPPQEGEEAPAAAPAQPVGYFTSMVDLKRSRKKGKKPELPRPPSADEAGESGEDTL